MTAVFLDFEIRELKVTRRNMTPSRVLRTALVALLLLDVPLISADWFGWLGSRASDGLSYVSRAAVELEQVVKDVLR